jgi:polar amino acid transport system substrate-binding protein
MSASARKLRKLFVIACAVLTAGLITSACGSSSSPSGGSGSSASIDGSSAFASSCAKIRAKYTGLPAQITVGTSPDQRPSEYVNPNNPSQIIGLEPQLMSTLAQCLNFKFSYSSEGFDNVIASVQSGRTPLGVEGVYITSAREQILDLVSYRVSEEEAIVQPSLVSKIHSVTDFCGLTSGVTTGSVELAYLQQVSTQCTQAGKPPITINAYQDASTIALSVADGRLDFSIGAAELVAPELQVYPGKIKASIVIPQLTFDIGVAITKHDPRLADAVLEALQGMQANNLEKPMLKKWGYLPADQVPAKLYT